MSCGVNKFSILKGSDNTFVFTIKQDGSTLPLVIDPTDTFLADLINLKTDVSYPALEDKPLVSDPSNYTGGKVTLSITAAETSSMVSDKAGPEDRYYLRPTYKLVLKCSTVNNGNFIAKVQEVYVE